MTPRLQTCVTFARVALRAAEQSEKRRARIAELEALAERMTEKLDAQEFGPHRAAADPPVEDPGPDGATDRGRRASDRGACSRFTRAVAEAELSLRLWDGGAAMARVT